MRDRMEAKIEDKELGCCDCGQAFTFSTGEQRYFKSKGLSIPKRCKPCRQQRRASLVPDSENGDGQ